MVYCDNINNNSNCKNIKGFGMDISSIVQSIANKFPATVSDLLSSLNSTMPFHTLLDKAVTGADYAFENDQLRQNGIARLIVEVDDATDALDSSVLKSVCMNITKVAAKEIHDVLSKSGLDTLESPDTSQMYAFSADSIFCMVISPTKEAGMLIVSKRAPEFIENFIDRVSVSNLVATWLRKAAGIQIAENA